MAHPSESFHPSLEWYDPGSNPILRISQDSPGFLGHVSFAGVDISHPPHLRFLYSIGPQPKALGSCGRRCASTSRVEAQEAGSSLGHNRKEHCRVKFQKCSEIFFYSMFMLEKIESECMRTYIQIMLHTRMQTHCISQFQKF